MNYPGIKPNAATFGLCTVCGSPRGWGQFEAAELQQIGMMCSEDPTHEINIEVTQHDITDPLAEET